jgi:hypothetical protein
MLNPIPSVYDVFATQEKQLERLKGQADYVEHVLENLRNRIKSIESTAQESKGQ